MNKILIAYYSRRGQNYVDGVIRDLEIGNTEFLARRLAEMTDGTLFRIDTVKPYPIDYHETTKQAMTELQADSRPELTDKVDKMEEFDTVVLGYPNWWGTMPMCVCTFLESYDLSGKIILPFCTHEGSALGHSEKDIKRLYPTSDIRKGLAIRGSNVKNADTQVKTWLKDNKLI